MCRYQSLAGSSLKVWRGSVAVSGRQYLDVSHLKISSSGGMRGLLHVTCKTSASLKALASRVCTNPHK